MNSTKNKLNSNKDYIFSQCQTQCYSNKFSGDTYT